MGRPSNRAERRTQILAAFARVLADHGYAGATIAAVAMEADVAPGLIHHHFADKEDLLTSLLRDLVDRFHRGIHDRAEPNRLFAYIDGALRLDDRADLTAARCWVGLFAEAIRNPVLFKSMRRLIDSEISAIESRANHTLDARQAGAVLAFIIGALVLGAFAPKKTAGFAAPALRQLVRTLSAQPRNGGA